MLEFILTKTPLAFLTQSMWRDEAFSFLLARQNIWEILVTTAMDFSPPLYYLVLHYWMLLFGSSEIAMRSLSMVFFCATIYVFDHFLVDILKIKSRWRFVYLMLIVINPFLIYYSYEARMYSMSVFFVTLSWYSLLAGKKKLHIVTSALALLTQYFAVFALLSQFLYLYLQKNHKSKVRDYVLVGAMFAPWFVFVILFHGSSDGSFWILQPTFSTIKLTPGIILTGFEQSFHKYSTTITALTTIAYGASLIAFRNVLLKDSRKNTSAYLLLWTFLPAVILLAISVIKPVFLPRYFIYSAVGASLLLVWSMEQLRPPLRTVGAILIIFFLFSYNVAQIEDRKKGDVRSVVRDIRKNIGAGDSVYVENVLDFHTAQYYFDSNRVFIYRKSYEEIPQYVGKVLIPNTQVVSSLPIFPNKAYIIRNNLTYDVQSMN